MVVVWVCDSLQPMLGVCAASHVWRTRLFILVLEMHGKHDSRKEDGMEKQNRKDKQFYNRNSPFHAQACVFCCEFLYAFVIRYEFVG